MLLGQHILYSSRIARYTSSCVLTCIEDGDLGDLEQGQCYVRSMNISVYPYVHMFTNSGPCVLD